VIASPTALNTVVASQVAMDSIAVSQVAMDAITTNSTAADTVLNDVIGRTLILTSAHIANAWKVENFVTRLASYLSSLPTVISGPYRGISIPIDSTLIDGMSIKSRVTSTSDSKDQQLFRLQPSGTIIAEPQDTTSWGTYAGTISNGETHLEIFQEDASSSDFTNMYVSTESPTEAGFSLGLGSFITDAYFYGLAFTRRAAA